MIIVMMVLLAVTSLGVFAIHATTYEVRAAGHARQAMQAQYVSEAGLTSALVLVDQMGPRAILHSIEQTRVLSTVDKPVMAPFEPELDAMKDGYRMYSEDMASFTSTGTAPVSAEAIGALSGTRQPYTPSFTVDVNDHYISSQAIAGQRADGLARLQFMPATYTARGRMRLSGGDYTALSATDPREYHETASGARAYGISGPFAP
jgi:hypothetical protein